MLLSMAGTWGCAILWLMGLWIATSGSGFGGAGCSARAVVCGRLGGAAGPRVAWDGLSSGIGESVSGHSAEGKQGRVRPDGHGAGDVQPVDLSAAGRSGVLVAGETYVAVGVMTQDFDSRTLEPNNIG